MNLTAGLDPPIEELLRRCRENDRTAQRLLFRRYKTQVYDMIARTLGYSSDIDEVAQQTFIRLFRSLQYFKGLSSFDTWVYRITSKVCIDQMRLKYRKRKLRLVNLEEGGIERVPAPDGLGPAGNIETTELQEQIRDALDRLDPDKRMAVVLFDIQGMSIGEVAEAMNIPSGTVKSRLFHARHELMKYLGKYVDRR